MARATSKEDGLGSIAELTVVLSERNLLALLSKLYIPGSARTLQIPGPWPFTKILLKSEEDETHYAHDSRKDVPAGEMSDPTENLIVVIRDAIRKYADENFVDHS